MTPIGTVVLSLPSSTENRGVLIGFGTGLLAVSSRQTEGGVVYVWICAHGEEKAMGRGLWWWSL